MQKFGEFLREAREAQGLSIEDVSRITRINPPMLRALEDSQLEKLPAQVIVRGFIRSYCKVVGIDAVQALDLYDQEIGPRDIDLVDRLNIGESDRSMKWIVFCAIMAVVILGIILFLYSTWSQDAGRKWPSFRSGAIGKAASSAQPKQAAMITPRESPAGPLLAQVQKPAPSRHQKDLNETQQNHSLPFSSLRSPHISCRCIAQKP